MVFNHSNGNQDIYMIWKSSPLLKKTWIPRYSQKMLPDSGHPYPPTLWLSSFSVEGTKLNKDWLVCEVPRASFSWGDLQHTGTDTREILSTDTNSPLVP